MRRNAPSTTAMLVAASVLRHGGAHGLGGPALALARAALRLAPWPWPLVPWLCRFRLGSALLDSLEARVLPGLGHHHCRRKAWLHARLRAEALPGQLLWLGVGLDAGHRMLAEATGHLVIETDHPATLALRTRAAPCAAAVCHPLQLPEHAADVRTLCASASTLVVAEGLLMYLPARPLLRLLRALAALERPPRLLFTALDASAGEGGFARDDARVRHWLARRGEPFLWRARPARLARTLARHGYCVQARWDGAGFGEYAIDAAPAARLSPAAAAR